MTEENLQFRNGPLTLTFPESWAMPCTPLFHFLSLGFHQIMSIFSFFKSPQIHTLLKSEEWKCQSLSSDISNFWNPLPMPPGRTTGHSSTCFYSCSSSPHGHRDDLTAQHAPLRMKTAMHLNMSMKFYTVCSWPVSLPHPALLSPILSVQPHRPSLSLHTAALSSTISIHMGLSLWCWFSFP